MKHYGNINKCKIDFLDEERFIEDLVKHDGMDIVITISENKDFRTNSQNKLWWRYMLILSKELGFTKNEMHDVCKIKFLKRERMESGKKITYLKSTTQLTRKEFTELVDNLIMWSTQTFNINLPNE